MFKGHNNDRGCYNLTDMRTILSEITLIADDGYTRSTKVLLAGSFENEDEQNRLKELRCVVETSIGCSHLFRASATKC